MERKSGYGTLEIKKTKMEIIHSRMEESESRVSIRTQKNR